MKTLLYFILFMVAVYGCASGKPLLVIFSTIPFCALLLVYIKLAYKTPKAKGLQRKTIKTTETELKESFAKAIKDYNVLQDLKEKITSHSVRERLTELQRTAEGILDYLGQNPERMSAAEEFIEIYQDRAVSLMNQYFSLERIQFSCREMDEAKIHAEKVLLSLNETYKKEFKKMLGFQFMDFHAEADVFQRAMGESVGQSLEFSDIENYIDSKESSVLNQENIQKKEEGFLKRNYCSMELDEKDPSVIDRVKQGKPMFFEYGIFLFFSFIVYAGLSFFRGAIDFDSDSVIGLIELARFAFMFFTGLLFAVGIGELNKEKFEWKSEF